MGKYFWSMFSYKSSPCLDSWCYKLWFCTALLQLTVGYLIFLCCLLPRIKTLTTVMCEFPPLVATAYKLHARRAFQQQAGNAGPHYASPQWSVWPLEGLAVGISHNAFSHRETSSQHEQGRNVARVWERPSGWREGVTDQRAWSREGRKEGVYAEGSRVSLKHTEFLFS